MNDNNRTAVSVQESDGKKPRFSRKMRFGTVSMITTVVVIVAILLLNVVMDVIETRYPLTVDLTSDGAYTLSDASVELAKGLDSDVKIIAFRAESYFTTPATGYEELNTVITQFYQALRQYQLESGGKVSYEFIDLDANPTASAAYADYNVSANTVLFLCGERYQTITFDDLYSYAVDYSTYATSFSSEVESVMAARINLVSAAVTKKVTLLTGHGEDATAIATLTKTLENNACYVTQLDITASVEPDEDTGVFVIAGATVDYTAEEIARVRDWLHNNGKREKDLVVLCDSVARLPNLYEMLNDEYGIEVLEQVVYEEDAANQYRQNPYYVYGNVAQTDYTEDLVGQRAMMGTVRALKLNVTDSTDEAMYAKPLITYGETVKLKPLARLEEEGASSTAADALQTPDSYPVVGAAFTTARMFDNDDGRYYATDVMVYGSTTVMYELVVNITSACNEDLFMNTFRGLTGLESVIAVSSRSLSQETLDFGGSAVPAVLGIGVFMVGLPVLLIIIAIVVFVRRKRL